MTERKYALTKLDAGDYLLPSNDAQTIWRISRYTDGPSGGIQDWPRDREFWSVRRWRGTAHPTSVADVDDWSRWDLWEDGFDKRREAIDAALRPTSWEAKS